MIQNKQNQLYVRLHTKMLSRAYTVCVFMCVFSALSHRLELQDCV